MGRVLTFGEIMLRLTTPERLRFGQAEQFLATFGGAEANVAVAIAQLGGSSEFLTRLPANELTEKALAELRGLDVKVDRVVLGGDRIGVYFLEQGASQRAGKVIYDRAHSAIAQAQPEHFDWEAILDESVDWLHLSGITPALSPQAPGIVKAAMEAARRRGIPVSFDLNYRAKLWTMQQAGEVLRPLVEGLSLCVTSAEEASAVLGIALAEDPAEREAAACRALRERFGIEKVALTMRRADTAETTEWGAMLDTGSEVVFSRRHQVSIVDRLGAGDSFTGALIFALRRGDAAPKAVEFAVAASALQHTIFGDYNRVSLEEVEALAGGAGGGRVRR